MNNLDRKFVRFKKFGRSYVEKKLINKNNEREFYYPIEAFIKKHTFKRHNFYNHRQLQ